MKRLTLFIVSLINLIVFSYGQTIDFSKELSNVFSKAIKAFPSDSASLYNFYYVWLPKKNSSEQQKQINRLEQLLTKSSLDRYYNVEKNLKPLLTKIVSTKSITISQAKSFVLLYSDYDYFSGEAMFSQLLTNEDNYNLVWKSLQILAQESHKDTCYISALLNLNNNIKTNAELAEAMPGFIIKAIHNNPEGFLDMYSEWNCDMREGLSYYILLYGDENLVLIFKDISKNSTSEKYRNDAKELLQYVMNNKN
jgi:hypothetical protein